MYYKYLKKRKNKSAHCIMCLWVPGVGRAKSCQEVFTKACPHTGHRTLQQCTNEGSSLGTCDQGDTRLGHGHDAVTWTPAKVTQTKVMFHKECLISQPVKEEGLAFVFLLYSVILCLLHTIEYYFQEKNTCSAKKWNSNHSWGFYNTTLDITLHANWCLLQS